jgi:SAM-dependent methyltransferase
MKFEEKIEFEKMRLAMREPSKIESIRELFSQIVQEREGKIALDIGCGAGLELKSLSDLGFMAIGIELYEDFLKMAKDVLPRHRKYFLRCYGELLPFKSKSFDLITLFDVLEHVDHPDIVLTEIKRTIKAGGHVVFTILNKWSFREFINRIYSRISRGSKGLGHVNSFNYFDLLKRFDAHGFDVDYFAPQGGIIHPTIHLLIDLFLRTILVVVTRDRMKVRQIVYNKKIIPDTVAHILRKIDNVLLCTRLFILSTNFLFICSPK